jgi:D-alanyl-D-alanine carboxypeptidase
MRYASFTRRNLLMLAAASAVAGPARADDAAALSTLLAARWQARYGGKPGGLTFLAITPKGEFFATTLDGVTPQSHFRGASTTKTFTAAAIMLLDQRGQLKIDDVLTATMPGKTEPYLPDTPDFAVPYKDQITIRELLSHRAGVFDITNQPVPAGLPLPYAGMSYLEWQVKQDPDHSFTPDELIGVLAATQASNSKPGAGYRYSDSHYGILAKIVERVSGTPLDQFNNKELLTPNGLKDTQFVVDGHRRTLPPPAISGFSLENGKVTPQDDYNYSYDPGSGNVFTTPADLARWIRLLVRGEAGVSAAQVARMSDVMPDSQYGLGLSHKTSGSFDLGFGHNGGTEGFLTNLACNPKTETAYVLVSSLIDFDALVAEIVWLDETAAVALQLLAKG